MREFIHNVKCIDLMHLVFGKKLFDKVLLTNNARVVKSQ